MLDLLHLDVQVTRRLAQHLVIGGVIAGVAIGDRTAERLRPEIGGGVQIARVAIDDEAGQTAAVAHAKFSRGRCIPVSR